MRLKLFEDLLARGMEWSEMERLRVFFDELYPCLIAGSDMTSPKTLFYMGYKKACIGQVEGLAEEREREFLWSNLDPAWKEIPIGSLRRMAQHFFVLGAEVALFLEVASDDDCLVLTGAEMG